MARISRIKWRPRYASHWVEANYSVGEHVIGPLGVVEVKAVGDSPLGRVYRVVGQNGEPYDLLENQVVDRVRDDSLILSRRIR
jgi:hypothetical protein